MRMRTVTITAAIPTELCVAGTVPDPEAERLIAALRDILGAEDIDIDTPDIDPNEPDDPDWRNEP